MNEELLISVIVPVYKAENTLGYCTDSVLTQSYKNLELLLVDDGSPDNSGKLCDEIASKDSRVKVIHKPNGGVSDARNAGLDMATGDYIMFVDNDDMLAPSCVEKMVRLAQRYDADIVQGKIIHVTSLPRIGQENDATEAVHIYSAEEIAGTPEGGYRTDVWGKIYRSRLAKMCKFPIGHYGEDLYYNGLILSESSMHSFILGDFPSYYYLDNPLSASHTWDIPHFTDIEKTIDDLYGRIKNKTINRTIIDSYLLVFFSQYCSNKYNVVIRNGWNGQIKDQFLSDRRKHIPELLRARIPLLKKAAYYFISESNTLYRLWVFYKDPTMRKYEKNVQNKYKRDKNNRVRVFQQRTP